METKTRRTVRSLYALMPWPDAVPPLTDSEAVRAARLLHRRFFAKRWKEERGSTPLRSPALPAKIDRRISYAQFGGGMLLVNPAQGWRGLVHSLSHRFHSRLRPNDREHSDNHRHLEKEMIAHVVASGWLDGKLKPKPKAPKEPKAPKLPKPKLSVRERNEARVNAGLVSWTAKLKKAETDLKRAKRKLSELRIKKRYYDRHPTFSLEC